MKSSFLSSACVAPGAACFAAARTLPFAAAGGRWEGHNWLWRRVISPLICMFVACVFEVQEWVVCWRGESGSSDVVVVCSVELWSTDRTQLWTH